MSEHDWEPVRGLPGQLPPGERIIWQGAPDWRSLLRTAFHGRLVALYFALLAAAGLLAGSATGALVTLVAGALCIGVLSLLAWCCARTTVYTLTNRRIVLRIGMAMPMCFNLPLKLVAAADLRTTGGTCGDLALTLSGNDRIAWAMLWPHVRPWRLRKPEPMLRSIPNAEAVAAQLLRACAALVEVEPGSVRRGQVQVTPEPIGAAA